MWGTPTHTQGSTSLEARLTARHTEERAGCCCQDARSPPRAGPHLQIKVPQQLAAFNLRSRTPQLVPAQAQHLQPAAVGAHHLGQRACGVGNAGRQPVSAQARAPGRRVAWSCSPPPPHAPPAGRTGMTIRQGRGGGSLDGRTGASHAGSARRQCQVALAAADMAASSTRAWQACLSTC